MELYNNLINETTALLSGATPKIWSYNPSEAWHDHGSSELVLQSDAAFELGATGLGSANYICPTTSSELVGKDEVLLYGPDIGELRGNAPFARIVLARVGVMEGDDEEIYRALKDIEFCKYHVYPDGYMVRMSPESYREQVRVSKQAVRGGISFHSVGANYIKQYKENPDVLNVRVIFITDPSVDYEALKKNAKLADGITSTLTHILEGLPTDCSVCQLKDVCDEVEGMKELHFGKAAKEAKHD
jgi:CO dehydrogenase/acetyl-CoA synthase beta subunit